MSNPSIVTKLLTLVKGAFGRQDTEPVPTPSAPEPRAGEQAAGTDTAPAASAARKHECGPSEDSALEEQKEGQKQGCGPAEDSALEEEAEEKQGCGPAEDSALETESVGQKQECGPVEAPEPAPATDDVPEKDASIARELDANEAQTEVASDEVLERVRKEAAPSAEDLPVPTYDELTLPSIRARLRKLTMEQVRDLRAYEVAHESRPEFIKMYDNRIAKLQSED